MRLGLARVHTSRVRTVGNEVFVTSPAELRGLEVKDLHRATAVYLEIAYPNGEIPESVRRRLVWDETLDSAAFLSRPPFEKSGLPGAAPAYSLRLGNARYPHMKLQIQPWPTSVGYVLSVNTHDQVLGLERDAPDAAEFRALQAENQRLKERIEQAWDEESLPTFLRYLRDFLNTQSEPPDATPESPA